LTVVLTACGSGDVKSQDTPVVQEITAEVCMEGEGRKTKLYVRNSDDFEWIDVKIDLTKGGQTYSMTLERLLPEIDSSADSYTDSTQFFYYFGGSEQTAGGQRKISNLSSWNSEKFVLTNFSHLQYASVEVKLPFPAKWTGEPKVC
jgi:hypothetical protein